MKRIFPTPDSDCWTVAECHTGEYPYMVRLRQISADFPRSHFPQRLNIFWSINESNEGFPSREELDRMHAFEARLIEAVEADEFAILTAILTGRGERECVFYTTDPQEFLRRLTEMPQEQERYPIDIHANEDQDWEYYENEVQDLAALSATNCADGSTADSPQP